MTLNILRPETTAAGTIWEFPNKSGNSVSLGIPSGVIGDWIYGQDTVPTSLYLEAASAGEVWLQLRLWTPDLGLVVDDDTIVFTALAPDIEVDLIIHDGLKDPFGGKEVRDEDGGGAVTVANKNDTDADTVGPILVPDSEDDDVRETRTGSNAHGRDEVDLMKLIAKKPKGYAGGAVTITVTPAGGRVKLWKFSTKQQLVDGFDPNTGVVTFNPWTGGDKEMWVEITTPSQQVADVEIKMTYGAKFDSVKAAAVWGTVEREQFDPPKDWADVPESPWKDEMEERLQKPVRDMHGGTGVRPIRIKDGHAWAQNVMLMEFTVTPADVTEVLPRVIFDISRQRKSRTWFTTFTDPTPQPGATRGYPKIDLPTQWEAANDDAHDEDESDKPNSNGHMYVIDAPGAAPPHPAEEINKLWTEDTFYEFLRVSFAAAPDGNGIKGGQCSTNIAWHSLTTITWDDFNRKWVRVAPNEIKRGFLQIDDLPP